ncbi:Gfo/Idh/MocA family oxidoreductase, partial [Enterovibrio sp. Hal110]
QLLGWVFNRFRIYRETLSRRARSLKAAINFQLRYAPMMLALKAALHAEMLGDLLDVELNVNIHTPWEMFPFLKSMERIELLVHSIHYIDLVRSIAGEPKGVFCRTMADPRSEAFKQTRTSIILDYDYPLRAIMSINHNHQFGRRAQNAQFRFEGTNGCITIKMGVSLDYPNGEADEFWMSTNGSEWESLSLDGSWFPEAFIGTMSNLQRFDAGEDCTLYTSVDDAFHTMAVVEACFESNNSPSHRIERT